MLDALASLRKAYQEQHKCPCCTANCSSFAWCGCDYGAVGGEQHPENCDNERCVAGGEGCGHWQDWAFQILQSTPSDLSPAQQEAFAYLKEQACMIDGEPCDAPDIAATAPCGCYITNPDAWRDGSPEVTAFHQQFIGFWTLLLS